MTIRSRLTLWYSAMLLMSMVLIIAAVYYEIFVEHPSLDLRSQMIAIGESPAEELGEALLFAGTPAVLLSIVGGWFLMRRALSPITRFSEAVGQIHAGNLHRPLPRTGNGDELDQVTEVFNAMTVRLDDSFQRVRDFSLHASHELKTPLTIIRAELETALRDEPLSAAERQRISSLLEELQRLTQIVDGLNFLTRADAGLLQFEKAPVRFDELVQEACADARVLGEQQRITVQSHELPPIGLAGDRRRLRQLLLILTDNAIRYNRPEGNVEINCRSEKDSVLLAITNTGAGIPPEVIDRVFDRFFRGDSSHNKEIDGCGLGLSIARRIVEAHRGDIRIESRVGQQTVVSVRLPRRRTSADSSTAFPVERAEESVSKVSWPTLL